ncbi:hypothetical protein [Lysobacter hankyongensis]|uniref:DUF2007 domain-containing protein n=1 Tax=Lysobacter hankyongensis TaxID=1176535 RepID=A0ABP9AH09_9GAMM
MRQVFTSPRLENVERVAELLKEHGVDARITNGRSYRGNRRGNFSYRDTANEGPQPAVWVVKSEDQPKARELLRAIGLLDSGRSPTSYLPTPEEDRLGNGGAADAAKRRAFRIRAALLVGIAFALGMGLLAWRKPAPVASTTAPAIAVASAPADTSTQSAAPDTSVVADATYVVATPSALAAMLIAAELRAQSAATLCVSVDGADPTDTLLAQMPAADRERIRPAASCAADAATVAVSEYRTDGSGVGTVRVEIADTGDDGRRRTQARILEVQRDDVLWKVKRVVM